MPAAEPTAGETRTDRASAIKPAPSPVNPSTDRKPAAESREADDDAAIRAVVAAYARAIESKDLALFRSIKPNLGADEERRIQQGFRAVTSQKVNITIVSIDRTWRPRHPATQTAGHHRGRRTTTVARKPADHDDGQEQRHLGHRPDWKVVVRASVRVSSVVGALVMLLMSSPGAEAQEPFNLAVPVEHAATLFTNLFGPRGLVLDSEATLPGEQSHSAHFNSDFQSNFSQFGTALVSQLVSVPLPSPASGFTYQLDPSTGVFQRSTRSFGPILAERADTIGAGHTSIGFAFQRSTFDSIEDLDLDAVPAVFTHDNAALLGGRQDVVTTVNSIKANVSQYTTFFTVGVTNRLDVSVAMPIVGTDVTVISDATIRRLGTTNPLTHFFRMADGEIGDRRLFTARASAHGIGDLTVRLKNSLHKTRRVRFCGRPRCSAADRR